MTPGTPDGHECVAGSGRDRGECVECDAPVARPGTPDADPVTCVPSFWQVAETCTAVCWCCGQTVRAKRFESVTIYDGHDGKTPGVRCQGDHFDSRWPYRPRPADERRGTA